MMRNIIICLLLLIGCTVLNISTADAHAYVKRSNPSNGSELQESPTAVEVWFSENIDTTLSKLSLVSADGTVIEGQQYGIGENGVGLKISPLKNGNYTIRWQILSRDSHVTEGEIRFSVGVPFTSQKPVETISLDEPETESTAQNGVKPKSQSKQTAPKNSYAPAKTTGAKEVGSSIQAVTPSAKGTDIPADDKQNAKTPQPNDGKLSQSTTADQQPQPQTIPASQEPDSMFHAHGSEFHHHHDQGGKEGFLKAIRALEIVLFAWLGASLYKLWLPSHNKEQMMRNHRLVLLISLGAIAILEGIRLWLTSSVLQGQGDMIEIFWTFTTQTVSGWVAIIRLLVIVAMIGLVLIRKFETMQKIGSLIFMMALIGTLPLTGHPFASSYPLQEGIAHGIHAAAGILWAGGLAALLWTAFRQNATVSSLSDLHQRLVSFAKLALVTMFITSATGIFLAVQRMESWDSLVASSYGFILLGKTALFAVVLVTAAIHRFYFLPRLQKVSEDNHIMVTRLAWSLRIELLLLTGVLVLAGILASTSPPS